MENLEKEILIFTLNGLKHLIILHMLEPMQVMKFIVLIKTKFIHMQVIRITKLLKLVVY